MSLEHNNAKITGTKLGIEDHGIMTFMIYLEWDGGGIGFGGYALDQYDEALKERVGFSASMDCIKEIMQTVGVENWEDLKGKYVVVESGGWGSKATGIRNILNEKKWFRPEQWFEERLSNAKS